MASNLSPRFFSLTNILLTSSFLFALNNAAPIPNSFNAISSLFTPRFESMSVRPRYPSLDNIHIGRTKMSIELPSGRSSRILPRTGTITPPAPRKIAERRGEIRLSHRSFTPAVPTQDFTVAAPAEMLARHDARDNLVLEQVQGRTTMRTRNSFERRSKQLKEASFYSREAAPMPSPQANFQPEVPAIGPTKVYSGKLWRRGLKRSA